MAVSLPTSAPPRTGPDPALMRRWPRLRPASRCASAGPPCLRCVRWRTGEPDRPRDRRTCVGRSCPTSRADPRSFPAAGFGRVDPRCAPRGSPTIPSPGWNSSWCRALPSRWVCSPAGSPGAVPHRSGRRDQVDWPRSQGLTGVGASLRCGWRGRAGLPRAKRNREGEDCSGDASRSGPPRRRRPEARRPRGGCR